MRLALALLTTFLISCGRDTNDAVEAYRYWAGGPPPSEVVPLEGKYWKSMHFTYEYEAFLHIKAPKNWLDEFFALNNIIITKDAFIRPENSPNWFQPPRSGLVYRQSNSSSQSFYVVDTTKNEIYLYEIQL